MESSDRELILKVSKSNAALRRLWQDHQRFEHELREFKFRAWLTPTEEQREKQLKFDKREGVKRMMSMIEHLQP
ncbi:MAG: hypothetical protein KDD42_03360 [Bdellovibrionales bacterium]|nr:hypothetical protein [Bdellovibrionales bacterium]